MPSPKSIDTGPAVQHKEPHFRNVKRLGTRVIRFDNVGLRYGSGPEILRDVTLHVLPGSFHFLTGPSGAGKTTLLRLLFMSLRPSRGLIFVFGENVGELSAAGRASLRRRIGIVFQDFRLLDHLTTWENVALPLRVMGKREADYREDVTDLLRHSSSIVSASLRCEFLQATQRSRGT